MKKVKRGRKASWNEDQITDMIDIIVNDDEMVKKLIFTNTKKASNSEVFKNVLTQLNEKYNAATGKDFPFVVAQIGNEFKWCVSTLKAFLKLPSSYVAQTSPHYPVFLILRRQLR